MVEEVKLCEVCEEREKTADCCGRSFCEQCLDNHYEWTNDGWYEDNMSEVN